MNILYKKVGKARSLQWLASLPRFIDAPLRFMTSFMAGFAIADFLGNTVSSRTTILIVVSLSLFLLISIRAYIRYLNRKAIEAWSTDAATQAWSRAQGRHPDDLDT